MLLRSKKRRSSRCQQRRKINLFQRRRPPKPPSFVRQLELHMKKIFIFCISLFLSSISLAETVKLKDGTFISGSIISQTEYTINLSTPYGPVVLSQRDIESVLPDQHRIYLKGGTQLVGVIVDLDEFNMVLQTADGIVNIDMPQIVSVEVYDYDQGSAAKQAIAQQQARQEQAAASAAVATTAAGAAPVAGASAQAAPVSAAGGLTFDADIEKVFDVKKPEIVNGQVQTVQEISAAEIRARRAQMSDEEAFLKGVNKTKNDEAVIVETAEAARSGKLEQIKKAEAKRAKRPKDSASDKYFAITVGAQMNDLKLDNTDKAGFAGTDPYDVGGTGVRAEAAFLWRVKSSNLWLGPALAIANIPNSSFDDKDPTIEADNKNAEDKGLPLPYPPGSDLSVHTSGQAIDLLLKANYYFNPDDLFSLYLTASGGYRMLSLNYRGVIQSETVSGNTFVGSVGIGAETHFDDMMLGLEVQEFFTPYSGNFKDSSVMNLVASVKFSWKF